LIQDDVYTKAKTNEHQICQEFVEHYLHDIICQLNACNAELMKLPQSCPSTFIPLESLDSSLKEFIYLQRKYLSKRTNDQLTKFKDLLHEKELLENLSKHNLTAKQVYKQSK